MSYVILLKRTEGKEVEDISSKIMQESVSEFEMFGFFFFLREPGACCDAAEARFWHAPWARQCPLPFCTLFLLPFQAWPCSPLSPVCVGRKMQFL